MEAPAGFHYRGQPMVQLEDGKFSVLVHQIDDEKNQTKKDKYRHLWCRVEDTGENPMYRCFCGEQKSCSYYKNSSKSKDEGNIDIGNIYRHVKSKHPHELSREDFGTATETAAASASAAAVPSKANFFVPKATSQKHPMSKVKADVRAALAEMIADKGSFPFSMVEDPHFRAGVRKIVSIYSKDAVFFPSRRSVRRSVEKLVHKSAADVRHAFQTMLGKRKRSLFPVTNDSSTSVAAVGYTCLTAQEIDTTNPEEWCLTEHYLDCSANPGTERHTAAASFRQIKQKLAEFLDVPYDSFVIGDAVSTGTFDCGSNTPAVFMEDTMQCMSHRWNTMLEHMDKLQEYQEALMPLYNGMDVCRRSVHNRSYLLKVQENEARHYAPVNGAQTRWTYDSKVVRRGKKLFKFMKMLDPRLMYFQTAAKREAWRVCMNEWQHKTQYYVEYLLPLSERIEFWTIFFESCTRVTVSFRRYAVDDVRAFVRALVAKVSADYLSIPVDIKDALDRILAEFIRQLGIVFDGQYHDIIGEVAELLDCRVAGAVGVRKAARQPLPPAYQGGSWLMGKLLEFYDTHRIADSLFRGDPVVVAPAANVAHLAAVNPFGGSPGGDAAAAAAMEGDVARRVFQAELIKYERWLFDDYTATPDEAKRLNRNPLKCQWPVLAKDLCPNLSRLAAQILECPAGIAGSERFFSRMGDVITKERSALDKELAGQIILHSMRKKVSGKARKELVLPLFGHLGDDVINIEDWDDDEDDDDYDENEMDEAQSDEDDVDEEEEIEEEDEVNELVAAAGAPLLLPGRASASSSSSSSSSSASASASSLNIGPAPKRHRVAPLRDEDGLTARRQREGW